MIVVMIATKTIAENMCSTIGGVGSGKENNPAQSAISAIIDSMAPRALITTPIAKEFFAEKPSKYVSIDAPISLEKKPIKICNPKVLSVVFRAFPSFYIRILKLMY
jgi:hypothetical protein